MANKPNLNSASEKELDRVEKQFDEYKENIDQLTLDRNNLAPKLETEPQAKLSQEDIAKSKDIYLKPKRTISSKEKFNEKFRKDYEYDKEYVQFIAENSEIIGESITMWSKPYPGLPAEEWVIPVNTPVWGPRYIEDQLKRCNYHRFTMENTKNTGFDHTGQYYGGMVVDKTVNRLDARPVPVKRNVFMGARNFYTA